MPLDEKAVMLKLKVFAQKPKQLYEIKYQISYHI